MHQSGSQMLGRLAPCCAALRGSLLSTESLERRWNQTRTFARELWSARRLTRSCNGDIFFFYCAHPSSAHQPTRSSHRCQHETFTKNTMRLNTFCSCHQDLQLSNFQRATPEPRYTPTRGTTAHGCRPAPQLAEHQEGKKAAPSQPITLHHAGVLGVSVQRFFTTVQNLTEVQPSVHHAPGSVDAVDPRRQC
ncbi:hypothetical protein NDU88_010568 [Pleurodeles waltl]|uniref:Uncharacterized protein n=1 Tax=Pleurodeles waltl TaxID=8319 RepID=A0AAV7PYR5_PLEWA|nr:hypothetical protein NDU88_010568 [Pleurodeles waltl]